MLSRAGVTFDENGARNLLTAVSAAQFDPQVIITETLRRVMKGSENEAEDVAAFWRNVEPILRAGKSLFVSHHMRKPKSKNDRANRDRASGSTDILAGADTAFAVQRLAQGSIAIECVKSRETEEAAEFVVCLDDEDRDGPAVLRFVNDRAVLQVEQAQQTSASRLALSFFKSRPQRTATTGNLIEHLTAHGVPERTAERTLPKLEKSGQLEKVRHGVWQLPG